MSAHRSLVLAPLAALACTVPAAAVDFVEDFTSFSSSLEAVQSGGPQGQTITTSRGVSQGGVSAIDGTSAFVTIDTTGVADDGSAGNYGGGVRTTLSDPVDPGDLTSGTASDYSIIFDVAANGFSPSNVDIFLAFRDSLNQNLFGQVSTNQNNANFAPFVASLAAGDGPVAVSINLTDFGVTDTQASLLSDVDNIQFQFFTRSPDSGYSADAGNVLVLDNVGIALIPEPASAALLGLGGTLLLARRRNRG